MDMDYITGRKYSLKACLAMLIHYRAMGKRMQLYARPTRKLIFWYQSDGQKQGIAVYIKFRSRHRPHLLIDLGCRNASYTSSAFDAGNRM